jgi:hypothetical protein
MGEEIIIDERDFLFLELDHEFWALGVHLDALEEQILLWQQHKPEGSRPPPMEGSIEYEHVMAEWAEHHATVEYVMPRLLRSSFVVLLWAAYEAAVIEIARFLRRRGQLEMADLRGDFTARSNKYYGKVLGLPLHSGDGLERLRVLEAVRHAIAHCNGRLTEVEKTKRDKIRSWMKKYPGISEERGCIMLSQGFVRQAFSDVARELERLIAIAKTTYARATTSLGATSDAED